MTDVPAFALAMVCPALGTRAVGRDRLDLGLFWVALLGGFAAFSVREYALVAPAAVWLTALLHARRWSKNRFLVVIDALLCCTVLALLLMLWRGGLPGWQPLSPRLPGLSSARSALATSASAAAVVGLLVVPAVVLAGPRHLVASAWSRAPRASVATALIALVLFGAELPAQVSSG